MREVCQCAVTERMTLCVDSGRIYADNVQEMHRQRKWVCAVWERCVSAQCDVGMWRRLARWDAKTREDVCKQRGYTQATCIRSKATMISCTQWDAHRWGVGFIYWHVPPADLNMKASRWDRIGSGRARYHRDRLGRVTKRWASVVLQRRLPECLSCRMLVLSLKTIVKGFIQNRSWSMKPGRFFSGSLDFSLMTYLLCLVLYLISYVLCLIRMSYVLCLMSYVLYVLLSRAWSCNVL